MSRRRLLVMITGDPVPLARERFGGFEQMIQRAAQGAFEGDWGVVDARTDLELPPPGAFDGVIVSGSPAHIGDGTPWIARSIRYLAELRRADVPTLGICFGHQLLGEALQGRVGANPNGREIGTVPMSLRQDNPLLSRQEQVRVNASHLDSIVELPPGARSYGSTEREPHALVHFGAACWGVQFHPEFDREIVRCYVRERRATLSAEGLDPEALHAAAEDAPVAQAVIPNFIRHVVAPRHT